MKYEVGTVISARSRKTGRYGYHPLSMGRKPQPLGNVTKTTLAVCAVAFMCVFASVTLSGAEMRFVAHADGPTASTTPDKTEELKMSVVNQIKDCERSGYEEKDAIVTFDPDRSGKKVNDASFGVLQFKISTVIAYYAKFYNKKITPKDAVLIALDEQKASDLALDVLFIDGQWQNWKTCSLKYDVPAQIKVIQKLTK